MRMLAGTGVPEASHGHSGKGWGVRPSVTGVCIRSQCGRCYQSSCVVGVSRSGSHRESVISLSRQHNGGLICTARPARLDLCGRWRLGSMEIALQRSFWKCNYATEEKRTPLVLDRSSTWSSSTIKSWQFRGVQGNKKDSKAPTANRDVLDVD